MQRQSRRDTKPELALRRALHGVGLRFRVERQILPGLRRRADVVFGPTKVAVFVDGCFWHSCPLHATTPKNNAAWWREKLAGNVVRDRDTDARLLDAGWAVIRVWEHDDPALATTAIADVVRSRRDDAPVPERGLDTRATGVSPGRGAAAR